MKKALSILFMAAALSACTNDQQPADTAKTPTDKTGDEVCTYSFIADSTNVKWTAYKFSDRVGVGGTFDDTKVTGTQPAENITDVFQNATMKISVASVNSKDQDRDGKILKHFFGSMTDTEALVGKMVSINDQTAEIAIEMNGVTENVQLDVAQDGLRLSLSGTMDLANWSAQASVDSLNTICYDLHTGGDGISKLWPDVSLDVTTVLKKECQ